MLLLRPTLAVLLNSMLQPCRNIYSVLILFGYIP